MHNTVDNAPLMIGPATQARKHELMPMKEAPQQNTDTTLATSKCAILIQQNLRASLISKTTTPAWLNVVGET